MPIDPYAGSYAGVDPSTGAARFHTKNPRVKFSTVTQEQNGVTRVANTYTAQARGKKAVVKGPWEGYAIKRRGVNKYLGPNGFLYKGDGSPNY